MKGWVASRTAADGTKRYDAVWRLDSGRKKSKTFDTKRRADAYLVRQVGRVHDGNYVDVRPAPMTDVFDRWLTHALEVRVHEGSLKASTARSYRSVLEEHLRPAFGVYRSDRLARDVVEEWRTGLARRIAEGTMARKTYVNARNLLHVILTWARQARYLNHDPLDGLPKLKLPRAKKRPHLEPDQVATLLANAAPPDDTIILAAVLSGLRRGELFALRWDDLDGARIHVRRSISQGVIDAPKTEDSDRVVDVPRRLLDELEVYRAMHPPIGEGYIFRTPAGRPLDADNWHHRRLVPLLKRTGLYQRGLGLHSVGRHTYVSLLITQGEDVGYIADQVGHSTTRLTQDLYRHVFQKTREEAMRRLDSAIPTIGQHRAEPAGTARTGEISEE